MTLDWRLSGLALGLVFFVAVLLVKPIGVSTEFAIFDGILWDLADPAVVTQTADGYTSTNPYLDNSHGEYAELVSNPMNYNFVFVIAMIFGGFISAFARGGIGAEERRMPALWRANFGDSTLKRYAVALLGGFIALYGARMAGGCTSGHMMSGLMQTSLSAYIFVLGTFATAVPTAMLLYRKEP